MSVDVIATDRHLPMLVNAHGNVRRVVRQTVGGINSPLRCH